MTLDVERRLSEVLHRHAENAMATTDTQEELREFLARDGLENRRTGRRVLSVAGASVAAAAAAAVVFWGAGLTQDRSGPAPAQETRVDTPETQVAEAFANAYAAGDEQKVASYVTPGERPWERWRRELQRDRAFQLDYDIDPCEKLYGNPQGTLVVCPFSFHAMGSEQVGRGPFDNGIFSVYVKHGTVLRADLNRNHEGNGLGQYLESVANWIEANYPDDAELMMRDEVDLSEADMDRWLALWEQHIADYVEAHS